MDDTNPDLRPASHLPSPAPAPKEVPAEFTLSDEAFNDSVAHDPTAHLKAPNAHHSSAWIKGPGSVTLLVEAARDLLEVSALRGDPATEITFVRLQALRSTKTLLVWPTHDKDTQKVEVTMDDGTAKFVASKVLRAAKIPVESGTKSRYNVHVLKSSKVGPVLAIDMRFDLETKVLPKQKSYSRSKAKKGKQEPPAVQTEDGE